MQDCSLQSFMHETCKDRCPNAVMLASCNACAWGLSLVMTVYRQVPKQDRLQQDNSSYTCSSYSCLNKTALCGRLASGQTESKQKRAGQENIEIEMIIASDTRSRKQEQTQWQADLGLL